MWFVFTLSELVDTSPITLHFQICNNTTGMEVGGKISSKRGDVM